MASAVAIEHAGAIYCLPTFTIHTLSRHSLGGPKIDMKYGRLDVTSPSECAVDGNLPGIALTLTCHIVISYVCCLVGDGIYRCHEAFSSR
jgi:hypothetical protein